MEHDRPLPNSPETEATILGYVFADNRLMEEAALIQPDRFYTVPHRDTFCAMLELYGQNSEIREVLVHNILKRQGRAQSAGGVAGLLQLSHGLPGVSNLRGYIRVLEEKWTYRQAIREANKIIEQAYEEEDAPESVIAEASHTFAAMSERVSVKNENGGEGPELQRIYEDHLYQLKAGVNPTMPTGLDELDRLAGGGISPGELWGIGALSSHGKTSLLVQWLRSMAKRKIPCVLFSLEMTVKTIAQRIGTSESGVSMKALNPRMPHSQIDYLLTKSQEAFQSVPAVYIDCRSIGHIKNRIQAIKRRHPLKVVGIDYYGLISGYGAGRDRYENKTQELKFIAGALQQQIAIGEGVGVIVPAQFNRAAWSAGGGPGNVDGGEAFYQACDLFATLELKSKDSMLTEKDSKAVLKIQKHRNGPTGKIDLLFNRERMEFGPRPEDEGEEDETESAGGTYL